MGSHPINLALRFFLELTALIAVGLWGWHQDSGVIHYILVVSLPATFALIWGLFNVPNDPSRSGKAPVKTPGWIRLFIELCLFGFAVWALFDLNYRLAARIIGVLILIHYISSYDRIRWLFKH